MEILGVGVPRQVTHGGFDFWLPTYVVLSLVLLMSLGRLRLGVASLVAAFVAGTAWAWVAGTTGVLPAAAGAVLLAIALGAGVRRLRTHRG